MISFMTRRHKDMLLYLMKSFVVNDLNIQLVDTGPKLSISLKSML